MQKKICKFNDNSQNTFNGNQLKIILYEGLQETVCKKNNIQT